MAYTAVSNIKAHLGITDDCIDSVISVLAQDVSDEIDMILDIDGFTSGTATETIQSRDVFFYGNGYYYFLVKNFNVTGITEINGTAYTGTEGVAGDWYSDNLREVYIKDLLDSAVDRDFDRFTVTYTYGYSAIPKDIQLAAKLMASIKVRNQFPLYGMGIFSAINGMSEYRLADEMIKFGGNVGQIQAKANAQNIEYNAKDEATVGVALSKWKKYNVLS